MNRSWILAGLLVASATLSVRADEQEAWRNRRLVTVQAQGKVQAIPDIARVTAEVRKEGANLEEISGEVRKSMSKILEALKAQGIEDKDVRTNMYQVQPKYQNDRRGNQKPIGYIVTNQVSAKVRKIAKVGAILTSVVSAGATGVYGPDFDFDDPQELERKALAAAMEEAKAKALVLVQAAKGSLGEVFRIDQQGMMAYPMMRARGGMKMATMAMAAEAEPIAAGEQDFTAQIQVSFIVK